MIEGGREEEEPRGIFELLHSSNEEIPQAVAAELDDDLIEGGREEEEPHDIVDNEEDFITPEDRDPDIVYMMAMKLEIGN